MSMNIAYRSEILSRNEYRWQLARIWKNWRIRRKITKMLDLDEHMLCDIGVEYGEVLWASKLPLSINSAIALSRRAIKRRSRFKG